MNHLEQIRFMAELAEQAERYEDMAQYAKQLVKGSPEICESDRKIFASAYKCKIEERRAAWKEVWVILQKESNSINKPIMLLYKQNLEREIRQICGEAIEIVTLILNKKSEKTIAEKDRQKQKLELKNKLEFYKIKGDCLRYLCQIARESQMKALKEDCEKAYKQAMKLMDASSLRQTLKTDALRLAICLNYSVFHYEIQNSMQEAIEICQRGFNEALEAISDLQDSRFADIVRLMQVMHDNITNWRNQLESPPK